MDAEVDIGGGIKAVGMQAIVGAMRVISAVLELVCVYKYSNGRHRYTCLPICVTLCALKCVCVCQHTQKCVQVCP